MIIRSIQLAAVAVTLLAGTASAQSDLQAVPRTGLAFPSTVTVRARILSVDIETRTVTFTTTDGRLMNLAVADGVANLATLRDETNADIRYNEVVTILNLRQKGPGSKVARKEGAAPDEDDIEMGRFTMTVVAVDLAANKVSLIDGRGGRVETYAANTPAKQELLKKTKVGDVVIGLTTPLTVTSIVPVK